MQRRYGPAGRRAMHESPIDRLANGYFSRHPIQALLLILLGFGLAGGIAPGADWLLAGGM